MTNHTLAIAHIPGDGIGVEVTEAAVPIIELAARECGVTVTWTRLDWGSAFFTATGRMMPEDGLERLQEHDAVFFGAMGGEGLPDHVATWGLRLAVCQGLDQYVSHRPAWSVAGIEGPLGGREFDLVVVRENSEGEYVGAGGRAHAGRAAEVAVDTSIFTRGGVRRVAVYAFELAVQRRGKVTSLTKSNVFRHSMVLWDEVVAAVALEYADVELERLYVDAAVAELILRPDEFDVILASNAYGDIVSDLTGAMMGSLGMAGSGNLDPTRRVPSMFEPAHGSAPDIAGTGTANPSGAIRSGALMLAHCGVPEAGARLDHALDETLRRGVRPPDLGGSASTTQVAEAVLQTMRLDGANGVPT